MSTLPEILASQEDLIREASLALPHDFRNCTYRLGHIRQAVYLCLTCSSQSQRRGICSACSIACHTDHEQLELFPKRNFRCDCPTVSLSHPCTLHTALEEENHSNQYGRNFYALFCRCGRSYDAATEKETMLQCLACEDWFHESCLNLRDRPIPSRDPTPTEDPHVETRQAGMAGSDENDDVASNASSDGLPHPLISSSDYESFVCGSCVLRIVPLRRWAGTENAMMIVRDSPSTPWKILGGTSVAETLNIEDTTVAETPGSAATGSKRPPTSSSSNAPDAKRPRLSPGPSSTCLAPPQNAVAQKILGLCSSPDCDMSLGASDLFLKSGWREFWCRCSSCSPSLEASPFLLNEEETYEPPQDPDCGLSLEELGMRALERLPRDRAIDGIHAFNAMRDDLVKYLRPFAQEGQVVKEADVRSFFDSLMQSARQKKESV